MTAPRKVLTLPARQLALANARMVIRDDAAPLEHRVTAADWLVMHGDEIDLAEGRAAMKRMQPELARAVNVEAERRDRIRRVMLACECAVLATVALCWVAQNLWMGVM